MKRLISICLALLLLLPGQVCASMLCLHGGKEMPCHHVSHKHGQAPALMQDCAKSDFQTVSSFFLAKPVPYAAPALPVTLSVLPPYLPSGAIRPPRGPPDGTRLRPPHLLITLRFRP